MVRRIVKIDTSKISKTLAKLKRKDPALLVAVQKKIKQIALLDVIVIDKHFKNLRHDLNDYKRVQVGSFVLIFRLKGDIIIFEDLDHHDKVYRKRT